MINSALLMYTLAVLGLYCIDDFLFSLRLLIDAAFLAMLHLVVIDLVAIQETSLVVLFTLICVILTATGVSLRKPDFQTVKNVHHYSRNLLFS